MEVLNFLGSVPIKSGFFKNLSSSFFKRLFEGSILSYPKASSGSATMPLKLSTPV